MQRKKLDPRKIYLQGDLEEQQRIAKEFLSGTKLEEVKRDQWLDLALIAVECRQWDAALGYVARAEKMAADEEKSVEAVAVTRYVRAINHREHGRLSEAEAGLVHVMQLALTRPLSPWLFSNTQRNLGLVFVKQENWDRAADTFQEACEYAEHICQRNPAMKGSLSTLYGYRSTALLFKTKEQTASTVSDAEKSTSQPPRDARRLLP